MLGRNISYIRKKFFSSTVHTINLKLFFFKLKKKLMKFCITKIMKQRLLTANFFASWLHVCPHYLGFSVQLHFFCARTLSWDTFWIFFCVRQNFKCHRLNFCGSNLDETWLSCFRLFWKNSCPVDETSCSVKLCKHHDWLQ